jgi:hypothetical protein
MQPNTADPTTGTAAIVALATTIALAVATIAVTVLSPATIPLWCAAHGGCP